KDLVTPGRTGMIVEPRCPDAFIREICACVEHPQKLAAMGHEGRQLALGRSWENIFDGLIRDYEEIIENRRYDLIPALLPLI
ncbi:hypothetical protein BSO21_27300, partial [Paenibacillus odorifer]